MQVSGETLKTAPKIRHVCIASSPAARRATIGAVVNAYAGSEGKS
jgi:hypothetical protein